MRVSAASDKGKGFSLNEQYLLHGVEKTEKGAFAEENLSCSWIKGMSMKYLN